MQLDLNFNKERFKSMADAVFLTIFEYPLGYQFFGNQLHDDVARVHPPARKMYPDTILRAARRHCRRMYKTVDHNRSLYERI